MAKKKDNTLTLEITLDLDALTPLSVAERKNLIEQTFASVKETAISAVTEKLS